MTYSINKYTGQEATNLQNAQNGFDVVAEHNTNTQTPDGSDGWIALQCLAAVTPGTTAYASQFVQIVSAESNVGDDLGTVFLQPGDIVYGNFKNVVNHTNSNATRLGIRG